MFSDDDHIVNHDVYSFIQEKCADSRQHLCEFNGVAVPDIMGNIFPFAILAAFTVYM